MMSITSSMPDQLHPNFWQPHFMNSQPNPVAMQQFLSSVTGNPVNPATAADSRNIATTT
jgi:hypothetical protein